VKRCSDYSLFMYMYAAEKGKSRSKLNVIFIILVPGREINMNMLSTFILRMNIVMYQGQCATQCPVKKIFDFFMLLKSVLVRSKMTFVR
jgi:hypothetical protein